MSGAVPVGTTKGPGASPHSYTMVAPDPDDQLKIGPSSWRTRRGLMGRKQSVLGRVDARRPLKLYPDAFMADPRIPPSQVAGLVGFDHATPELYELDVAILGYFDKTLGFVNPRVVPRAGRPVHLVPDGDLGTGPFRGFGTASPARPMSEVCSRAPPVAYPSRST